jgi:hypothetical protein
MKVVSKDGNDEEIEVPAGPPVEEESTEDPLAGKWQFDWKDVEDVLKDTVGT